MRAAGQHAILGRCSPLLWIALELFLDDLLELAPDALFANAAQASLPVDPESHAGPLSKRTAATRTFDSGRLLSVDHVGDRVDQREVRERLRVVAQMTP
jgi:hypothetical protein